MWLLVLVLTIILWFVLDNILIAAMLAIFALFLFTTTRALCLTRKQLKAQAVEVNNGAVTSSVVEVNNGAVASSVVAVKNTAKESTIVGASDEVDSSSDIAVSKAQSDRGVAQSDRGVAQADSGVAQAGRNVAQAGRGVAQAGRGVDTSSNVVTNSAPELVSNVSAQEEMEVDDSYLALVEEVFRETGKSTKHE